MTLNSGQGIVDIASLHSVDATVEKIRGILAAKSVTLFALVDHSGEAEKAGMKMPVIRGAAHLARPAKISISQPAIAVRLQRRKIWSGVICCAPPDSGRDE